MCRVLDFLFAFLLFIYIMMGVHAWPLWFLEVQEHGIFVLLLRSIVFLFCLIYILYKRIRLNRSRSVLVGLLFLFMASIHDLDGLTITGLITYPLALVFVLFPLWVLLSLKKDLDYVLNIIINWLAILFAIGLPLHIVIIFKGLLPGIPIYHPASDLYYFFNYIILLEKPETILGGITPRFQSISLEPGYLATLVVFLLYAIKFNLRKYKSGWILLVALIFSFSLAGYITGIVGFIMTKWSKKSNIFSYVLIGVGFFLVLSIASIYNDGDNAINKHIVERLEAEDGDGKNMRTGNGTDFYFEKALMNGDFVFGLGSTKIERINGGKGIADMQEFENQIVGAGYKIFILYNGLVSAIFYLFGYYYIGVRDKINRRYFVGFMLLIIMTFIQAAYPDSYSWLVPFIFGTANDRIINIKCQRKAERK